MQKGKDRHTNRPAHNRIELSGKRFGKLRVIEDTGLRKSRRPVWRCLCDCGNEVNVLGKYLNNGDTKSCGCFSTGNAHNRDSIGSITKSVWTPIVKQAKTRCIPFEVTREEAWAMYLEQGGLCALSGTPIKFSVNLRDDRKSQTASLDRIDSSKGYVSGNIQWVHKKVNIMKNVMGNEELFEWATKISNWLSSHYGKGK